MELLSENNEIESQNLKEKIDKNITYIKPVKKIKKNENNQEITEKYDK